MVEKNGIPLNVLWECIQNIHNGDDLIAWPSGPYEDNDTSGSADDMIAGWIDDEFQSPYVYEPEEIPDVLGDLLEIDFLKTGRNYNAVI